MFDSDLSPRELNEKFDWQAVKKIVAGSDKTDGEIIKENIKKYGGFFGKVIKRRTAVSIDKMTPNNNVSEKSDDEQFYGTRDALTDPKENLNDKLDDFNKLMKILVTELRKLMKRVAQIQGSRGDDDSEGNE
ncbi:hypothetical protein RhiirA4_470354 [Rhizophagus irregularis]|uniref:Uncharacterized protein n=1 Tax=Rhizophagus irregularis TaxID=588596 RepID=A0A2I1H194_9GLOM|nr:hypothetical protein RhiirA4_470354 [Rhizophagus irregularis]